MRVSSESAHAFDGAPFVAADSQGNAIIFWADSPEYPAGVYAQKLTPAGEKLWPGDVRVNGAPAYRVDWGKLDSVAIAIEGQDNVAVVWEGSADNNWTDPDVYPQKLSPDGRRLWASDAKVNTDTGHAQRGMAVGANTQGVLVGAWVDERGDAFELVDWRSGEIREPATATWLLEETLTAPSRIATPGSRALARPCASTSRSCSRFSLGSRRRSPTFARH